MTVTLTPAPALGGLDMDLVAQNSGAAAPDPQRAPDRTAADSRAPHRLTPRELSAGKEMSFFIRQLVSYLENPIGNNGRPRWGDKELHEGFKGLFTKMGYSNRLYAEFENKQRLAGQPTADFYFTEQILRVVFKAYEREFPAALTPLLELDRIPPRPAPAAPQPAPMRGSALPLPRPAFPDQPIATTELAAGFEPGEPVLPETQAANPLPLFAPRRARAIAIRAELGPIPPAQLLAA